MNKLKANLYLTNVYLPPPQSPPAPPHKPTLATPSSTMAHEALSALTSWKPDRQTRHISLCPNISPRLDHQSAGPGTFVARASFQLPDGGRFTLLLSGSTHEKTVMPLVEDELGLPDGFLIDVNTYLLTTLGEDGRLLTPHEVVHATLSRANKHFEKTLFSAPKSTSEKKSPSPESSSPSVNAYSLKRKRSEATPYVEPVFGYNRLASTTLMKQIALLKDMDTRKDGFMAEPEDDDLYRWNVRLYFDDTSSPIAADLAKLQSHDHVKMEFRFPAEYPTVPPIVRVMSPYIIGGHVASHGGICMELLTTSGWAPVNSIDVVCIQIRAMLIQGGARIDPTMQRLVANYTFDGALKDLKSIVTRHHWNVVTPRARKFHQPS